MKTYNMGPGSGKTATSLEIIKEVYNQDMNVIYCSITNSAVDDAKKRFYEANAQLDEEQLGHIIKFTTMHSHALDMIRKAFPHLKVESIVEPVPPWTYFRMNDLAGLFKLKRENKTEVLDKIKVNLQEALIEKDTLRLPLDWAVRMVYLYDLKPDINDVLILDEYQDFDQNEVVALAQAFGDNAVLFGDTNQSIFMFRLKEAGVNVAATNDGDTVKTYRLPKDSAQLVNRFLLVKRALTGKEKTPICFLTSDKITESPSFQFIIKKRPITCRDRNFDEYKEIVTKGLPSDPQTDIISISMNNSDAVNQSAILKEKYGNSALATRYVRVAYHPLYEAVRYFTRSAYFDLEERRENSKKIIKRIRKTLFSKGTSTSDRPLGAHNLVKSSNTSPKAKCVCTWSELMNFLKDPEKCSTYLYKKFSYGRGEYSETSERRSMLTLINLIEKSGLSCAYRGVRLDLKNPKGSIRVATIHSAKGLEADYVISDLSGGWNFNGPDSASQRMNIYQYLNMLYVAISRHKEKCFVILPRESCRWAETYMSVEQASGYEGDLSQMSMRYSDLRNEGREVSMAIRGTIEIPLRTFGQISTVVNGLLLGCRNSELFEAEIKPFISHIQRIMG